MHFLFHLLFRARGKGILVLPLIIFSYIVVFGIAWLSKSQFNFVDDTYTESILSGISAIIAGFAVSRFTKNFTVNSNGEKEYYEEEGVYMFIKVSLWPTILFMLGIMGILATIADKCHF
jgi:hypothetical protein